MPKQLSGSRKRKNSGAKPISKKRKTSSASKKGSVINSLITEQRDFRVDYVAPRKSKINKSVKNFNTKVMKALQRVHPVVSNVIVKGNVNTVTTAVTEQYYQIYHLKPYEGQAAVPGAGTLYNEQAQNDISALAGQLDAAAGLSKNFTIKYAEMEVCIQNTQASADQMLDIYEIEYINKAGNPMNQFASLNAAITSALSNTTTVGTAYTLTTFGVTPFDIVALVRDYGIKIAKKVTFVVKADDIVTYRLKDYKRHVFDTDTLETDLNGKFCIPGKTKTLLIIGKSAGNDATTSARISAVKRYHVQPEYAKSDITYGGTL